MKYVRICDEYENEYLTTYKQHCEDVANMQDSGFDFEGCIIKQADTIEELIDAYFIVSIKEDNNWCVTKEKITAQIYNQSTYGYYVYGAIKIKENDQYIFKTVTKPMNGKGELELL